MTESNANPAQPRVRVSVCETCGYDPQQPRAERPGAQLASLFEAAELAHIDVRRTRCLMACERPCAVALQTPGKYSYVVCDMPVSARTVEALNTFAGHYSSSVDGTVPWSQWPELLKGRFAARLPW